MPAIESWIVSLGTGHEIAHLAGLCISVVLLVAIALIANHLARRVIVRAIDGLVAHTRTAWDDRLMRNGVFARLSHIAPAIAIQLLAPVVFETSPRWIEIAQQGVNAYLVVIGLMVVDAMLNTALSFLEDRAVASRVPVKSFIQAVKLVVFLLGFILLLSVVFDRNPLYFFSGLGALTAVLLLVFKDSILGLVAGVQLSVNNMVRKGDWIEMPGHGADGDVIDVTLTTIKVQNWDRTITTVPTYALISEAFKNWRGMSESGGRRLKRALSIDLQSVRFVDERLLERLLRIQRLRPYLEEKIREIDAWNDQHDIDPTELVNGRRMTNLGCFRAYCAAYLRHHPMVHQESTFLVRHLQPTDTGIPIEIYVFVNDTRWAIYEGVQADIFDHLIAVIPHFDLRLFQSPTGRDITALRDAGAFLGPGRPEGPRASAP